MNAKKIVSIIKEMMVANAPGSSGGVTSSGITISGFDPLIKFKNKKKSNNIDFRKVPKNYKTWVRSIKNK